MLLLVSFSALPALQYPGRWIALCQMDADMILHIVAVSERRLRIVRIHISRSKSRVLPSSHYPSHWLDACAISLLLCYNTLSPCEGSDRPP